MRNGLLQFLPTTIVFIALGLSDAVAQAPIVTRINPASALQGQAVDVTITGKNFVTGTIVGISGSGVQIAQNPITSPAILTARFTITGNADTTAPRTVTITRPNGTFATVSFNVKQAASQVPALSSITPISHGFTGLTTATVAFNGSNFVPGATAVAVSGSDVKVIEFSATSDTLATGKFMVAQNAAPGARNVQVVTAGGKSTQPVVFSVFGPPTISSMSPSTLPAGSNATNVSVSVAISGTNFAPGSTLSISPIDPNNPDITFVPPTISNDYQTIQTTFTIKPGVSGTRTVTVTTPAGNASKMFSVGGTVSELLFTDPASTSFATEITLNTGVSINPTIQARVGTTPLDGVSLSCSSLDPIVVVASDCSTLTTGGTPGFATVTMSAGGLLRAITVDVPQVSSGSTTATNGIIQNRSGQLFLVSTDANAIYQAQSLNDQSPAVYAGSPPPVLPGFLDGSRLNSGSKFHSPAFVALDQSDGNLFVSDSGNYAIRKVQPASTGTVQTIAGSTQHVSGNQDGAGTTALFNNPQGIALDGGGNIWVVDSGSHNIRRIDRATVQVTTIAGSTAPTSPVSGFINSNSGHGTDARFTAPVGIAWEKPLNNCRGATAYDRWECVTHMLVADTGNGVLRRVWEDGLVETVAFTGNQLQADFVKVFADTLIGSPTGVATDSLGNIYVSQGMSGRVKTILRKQNGSYGAILDAVQPSTFSNARGLAIAQTGRVLVGTGSGPAGQITYGAPQITKVTTPTSDPAVIPVTSNSTVVTIQGKNFEPNSVVFVGGISIPSATIVNTTTITFTVAGSGSISGLTTLSVLNRGGLAQFPVLVQPTPLSLTSTGNVTTVAGGSTYIGDGGLAASLAGTATTYRPAGLTVDSDGNILLADHANSRIRRIDSKSGVITTIAGTGEPTFNPANDNNPALSAVLDFPGDVNLDSQGNLYIADTISNRIRKVTASTGNITTIAGTYGEGGYGAYYPEEGAAATAAHLYHPFGVAVDAAGNVFIADSGNNRIRKINAPNAPECSTTVVNTPFVPNGTVFTSPCIYTVATGVNPMAIRADAAGNIYFAESGRIRKISSQGTVTTVAGTGTPVCPLVTEGDSNSAFLSDPRGIAFDADGKLLVSDHACGIVWKLDVANGNHTFTRVAGNGATGFADGPAASASFNHPFGVAADGAGNIYVSDFYGHRLRKIDISLTVTTILGTGEGRFYGDDKRADAAALNYPQDVASDSAGNLYILDSSNNRVRKVQAGTGVISAFAGNGGGGNENVFTPPSGIPGPATSAHVNLETGIAVGPNGDVFFVDSNRYVRKVSGGQITNYAGNGNAGTSGDGQSAVNASFGSIGGKSSIAIDSVGNLYIADAANNRVRKVAPNGIISTFAGGGAPADGLGDNLPAIQASLNYPSGIAVDSFGNVYIADRNHYRIRKVAASNGNITTIAGTGVQGMGSIPNGNSGDGGPASAATFYILRHLAIDASNNLYVADGYWMRKIAASSGTLSSSGTITRVAGTNTPSVRTGNLPYAVAYFGDDGPAVDAGFYTFYVEGAPGLSIDGQGNLYISDAGSQRIRAARLVGGNGSDVSLSVSIAAPKANSTVTGTVSIFANVSPIVGVLGVQFQIDDQNYGVEDTTAPYSIDWSTAGLTEGSPHKISAIARNNAATTPPTSIMVIVQNKKIEPYLITGGGGTSSSPTFGVAAIIGQPAAGSQLSGSNFTIRGGFQ